MESIVNDIEYVSRAQSTKVVSQLSSIVVISPLGSQPTICKRIDLNTLLRASGKLLN